MFASIKDTIAEGNLAEMITAVEEHVNDEDYTAMDMAAALLKLSMGDINNSPEDLQPAHYDEKEDNSSSTMVRLFINIGKKQGVKPSNILGAIAGESGIPGKLVGGIDMYDSYTFVEVPRKHANEVLAAMENVKIKGKSINIERASSNRKGSGNRER